MRKKIMVFLVMLQIMGIMIGCKSGNEIYLETVDTENADFAEMPDVSVTEAVIEEATVPLQEDGQMCYVYVCGEVRNPGVYCLPEDGRVYEAIQMAGGLTEDAGEDVINQAECISDGQMIRVPNVQEAQQDFSGQNLMQEENVSDGRININTATETELMTLPGVGKSKAAAILAYREEHGSFTAIEELMNVTGIKEGIFDQMKEYIKVN